jgi:dihydrofolate reductase
MAAELVDEIRLMVFPIVRGTGKRLFEDAGSATTLRLLSTRQAGETLIVTYVPQ